ncbi:MAG: DUF3048 domain-containing protein, partial [Acidimicrobiales bacterium]
MAEPSVRNPPTARRAHRRAQGVVGLLLVALGAAACSSGGGAELAGGKGRTTTTIPQYFPLTGQQANAESVGRLDRAAVTVKVENSPQSRPQGGLDVADVVFEPVVEGGQTRFLAV